MNQNGYPKGAQTKVEPPTTKAVKSPFADHIPGLTESPLSRSSKVEMNGLIDVTEKMPIIVKSQDKNIQVPLTVELATTEAAWEKGLMFRNFLPADEGMLFVFWEDESYGFWMKDTHIPLTVAYIDRRGQIVELQDLEPLDEMSETPSQSYRYVLEVNQGWFESHGLGIGSYIVMNN